MAFEPEIYRVEDDTAPLTITLKERATDFTTAAVDLTGATVLLYIRKPNAGINLTEFDGLDVSASIPTPTNGTIEHTLTSAQTSELVAANYEIQVRADFGSGDVRTYPSDLIGGAVKNAVFMTVGATFKV